MRHLTKTNFFLIPEYSDLLQFGDNEEENYLNCITVNKKNEPFTSTQKTIAAKKFYYQNNMSSTREDCLTALRSNSNERSGTSCHKIMSKASSHSENSDTQSPIKPKVSGYDLLVQNNTLLKETLKELKYLRREQKCMRKEIDELKNNNNNNAKKNSSFSLNIPRGTQESFLELEEEVKTEIGEIYLV